MGSKIKEIYRKGPEQVENDLVSEAIRPGTLVKRAATGHFEAADAADDNADLFVLDKQKMRGQSVDGAYVVNDPGRALRLVTGLVAQARAVAANYAVQAPVTIADNGLITAATSGKEILGYVETARNISAADVTANENLLEVTFTNRPAAG